MPDGASFKTKETVFKLILGIFNLLLKFSRKLENKIQVFRNMYDVIVQT